MPDSFSPSPQKHRSILVTGGARSGKSAFAQSLVEASGLTPVYLATAQHSGDAEMAARIGLHRAARGSRWQLVEEPLELATALAREARADRAVLVDCLTLWLSNVMFAGLETDARIHHLAQAVSGLPGPVVFVTNEVGSGIVPDNRLARDFRDAQGRLNQTMARACAAAVLVVAGLPVVLKPTAAPLPTL